MRFGVRDSALRLRLWLGVLAVIAVIVAGPELAPRADAELHAQTVRSDSAPDAISIHFAEGQQGEVAVALHRGYPAVAASALESMGWQTGRDGAVHRLLHRTGLELRFISASPYFRWDGELLQMVEPVYVFDAELYLPLQILSDFFPAMLPNAYRYDPANARLEVAEAPVTGAPGLRESGDRPAAVTVFEAGRAQVPPPGSGRSTDSVGTAGPPAAEPGTLDRPTRLVVIDPGHGGDEPGAIGVGGVQEKDIALAIGLALARELSGDPDIEVRMTRERDEAVPIWERGERATRWKDEGVAVFLSIHANAVPDRPGVRGFETYFLSEARTEHERRVAAAENAPLYREQNDGSDAQDPRLAMILRDLRTFDHQQWSSLLADLVQQELGGFHPGADRGVKQGPLAVLTNALMPAVLIEVGFLTNRDEERLLTRPDFHRDTAASIARAVQTFFARYPSAGG